MGRDHRHYHALLDRLDEHRDRNNLRIQNASKTGRSAPANLRERLTKFFEEGTGEEPDLSD